MALIKEPKNIDLNIKSKEWSERDLKDFRLLMKKLKNKKSQTSTNTSKRKAIK
ncbi:MAG: hypothetical protein JST55_02705 [Bacteroidetes bacterium]|nr:hypothetical protein [Bacteroidota bacterium]